MKMTDVDRLKRDLYELIETRRGLDGILKKLAIGRTVTLTWIRYRIHILLCDIDYRIGLKKREIQETEIRRRLGEEEKEDDLSEMGTESEYDGDDDGAADDRTAADHGGRAETGHQQERKRADGHGRRRDQLEEVGTVRAMAAGEAAGPGSAEECLRARYRERHEGALMDWQREIMEADRAGKHERLTI